MSFSYQIQVSESVQRVVHVEDGVASSIELLPILPPDRMQEVLANELEKQGFKRDQDTLTRESKDGITVTVDLPTGTVTVRVVSEQDVTIKDNKSKSVYDRQGSEQEKEALREQLKKELEGRMQAVEEKTRQAATSKLEEHLKDLKPDLDRIANKVHADALKEKASQIGEIEEIHEDGQSGSLTIKVKL